MQTFVLEAQDRLTLRDAAIRMWDDLKLSGEMGLRRTEDGRWRLEVCCERELDEKEIRRFGTVRIE